MAPVDARPTRHNPGFFGPPSALTPERNVDPFRENRPQGPAARFGKPSETHDARVATARLRWRLRAQLAVQGPPALEVRIRLRRMIQPGRISCTLGELEAVPCS